jgi:uncharacterized protein YdiU (UPF0061 family)
LERYVDVYTEEYEAVVAAKLGLPALDADGRALAEALYPLLAEAEVDYTLFFRALGDLPAELPADRDALLGALGDVFYDESKRDAHADALARWLRRWHARAAAEEPDPAARRARLHRVNPRYVLRNYLAQQAIDRVEAGDASMVRALLDVMRRPYDDQPEYAEFARRRPEWARDRAGCSMLSCSS